MNWKSKKRIYGGKFLAPLHPLNNIEITNYFNYEPRFNGVYSRNNLPRIKDGAMIRIVKEHIWFHYLMTKI